MSTICEDISPNTKQRLTVQRVLSAALAWKVHSSDAPKWEQLFVFVTGEGGVGKSRVIKAIVAGMDLILRKSEVVRMAPTGSAGYHIGGNTYHASLGIGISKTQKSTVSTRVRNLWSKKSIMIIDEVSMMDLTSLSIINNRCKVAKSQDRSSPDFFGGLPIVLFMGDFFQFPPVRGPALWSEPRPGNDEDANGKIIWHMFKNVIILDEQMRQARDPRFRELLHRARAAALTEDDLALLNSRVATSLFTPELESATIIVRRNVLRQHINQSQMEHFARRRSQRIYIFPAEHSRVSSSPSSPLFLEDLLQQTDEGAKVPFQGLFFYTLGMPAVYLYSSRSCKRHVRHCFWCCC
jgi:PIF1-like helicase